MLCYLSFIFLISWFTLKIHHPYVFGRNNDINDGGNDGTVDPYAEGEDKLSNGRENKNEVIDGIKGVPRTYRSLIEDHTNTAWDLIKDYKDAKDKMQVWFFWFAV